MDYKMIVEIPLLNVPDNVSLQEAKVTSEIWLKNRIPDAKLLNFKKTNIEDSTYHESTIPRVPRGR